MENIFAAVFFPAFLRDLKIILPIYTPDLKSGSGFQRPDGAFFLRYDISLMLSVYGNLTKSLLPIPDFLTLKHDKNNCFLKNYGITITVIP